MKFKHAINNLITLTVHYEALLTYNLVCGWYLLNSFMNCFSLKTEDQSINHRLLSTRAHRLINWCKSIPSAGFDHGCANNNHSFYIHSGYFYSASSSPLLLRGAPDYSIDTLLELTREALQATVSEGLAQGPYVAARVRFKPATLRTQGEPTTEPPRPTKYIVLTHMCFYMAHPLCNLDYWELIRLEDYK